MGCRLNIYQIVSEGSCLKRAPPWDSYPWPLGRGFWTQNVCASTGAWASIIVRAGLTKSLSRNFKEFPMQLKEWGEFCWLGVFVSFVHLLGVGFGLVLSFWWLKAICFSDMFSHCRCDLAQRGGHPSMALLTKGQSPHNWKKQPSNRSIIYFCVIDTK